MGLWDKLTGKADRPELDPLKDLTLSKLKVGYFLDYDLKTWQVTAQHKYDLGDGYIALEWELTSGREKRYLERAEDDEVEWSLSKKLPLGAIEGNVARHIIDHEDPPNEISVKGKTYYLDESGSAYYYPDGKGPGVGMISWTFIDEDDEAFVTIEQWGEEEFEASEGIYVEEYNNLPAFYPEAGAVN